MSTARGGHLGVAGAPPHDLDAEESLLGAMLLSAEAVRTGMALCGPADFYKPTHGHIFQAIERLAVAGQPSDPVTVMDELGRLGLGGEVEGSFLIHLQLSTPSVANAGVYAEIVARHARSRRHLRLLAELQQAIMAQDADAEARLRAQLDASGSATRGLEAVDIGAIMRSPEPEVVPTLFRRVDGQCLLVPGSLTIIHGEPTSGKSWVTLEAARQALEDGLGVVMLDYEGSPRTTASRLMSLGVADGTVDEHFRYFQPRSLEPHLVARVIETLHADLVIVDGLARALAGLGLDEDKAADSLAFLAGACRPLADAGAAVVIVDHVQKAKDARGRWGRGSSAKLGEVDTAFALEVKVPFARGVPGSARLRVAKDRWGAIGAVEGAVAAVVSFCEDLAGRLRITLRPLEAEDEYVGPTHCMDAIEEVLREARVEMTGRELISALRAHGFRFREATVREAAERLALDPDHPVTARDGARRGRVFRFDESLGLGDEE